MPQVSGNFGPIYQTVVLDGSGNGSVSFQAVGSAISISNVFFKVATTTNQAVCTIYKGQVAEGNIVFNSNSGSTGGNAKGNLDLFDGETVFVRWTGGDSGATATATFTGRKIPFREILPTDIAFEDPIAAGDGSLIFSAIKSVNFVAGVQGWETARSGSAEFNNVVVRGELDVNGDFGSYIRIYSSLGQPLILLNPAPPAGDTISSQASISAQSSNSISQTSLVLAAPILTGQTKSPVLFLSSGSSDGTLLPTVTLGTNGDLTYPTTVTIGGHLQYAANSQSVGEGVIAGDIQTSDSATVGATETVALTCNSTTYRAGRAYRISLFGETVVSVGTNTPVLKVRKTNTAGSQFGQVRTTNTTTSGINAAGTSYFVVGATDVVATMVATITGSGVFNATHHGTNAVPRGIVIEDVGSSSNPAFTNAPVLS